MLIARLLHAAASMTPVLLVGGSVIAALLCGRCSGAGDEPGNAQAPLDAAVPARSAGHPQQHSAVPSPAGAKRRPGETDDQLVARILQEVFTPRRPAIGRARESDARQDRAGGV